MIEIILLILVVYLLWSNQKMSKKIERLLHDKMSIAVRHGKSFEQLFPFFKNYNFNSENFRFLGSPIDGVQFENDKIIFLEFKTGKSKLSKLQKKIMNIVKKGKVEFTVIRA